MLYSSINWWANDANNRNYIELNEFKFKSPIKENQGLTLSSNELKRFILLSRYLQEKLSFFLFFLFFHNKKKI
jgi:hypothetical protein